MATPRVAKAVKAEIPCVDDLVGKLEDIGDKTKDKLANLAAAAETCGALDLAFPFPSVTTGQPTPNALSHASPQYRFTVERKKKRKVCAIRRHEPLFPVAAGGLLPNDSNQWSHVCCTLLPAEGVDNSQLSGVGAGARARGNSQLCVCGEGAGAG